MTQPVENTIFLLEDCERYHRCHGPFVAGLVEFCKFPKETFEKAVEVGSFSGESAEIIAQFCEHLTCVDPWDKFFHAVTPTNPGPEPLFDRRMARFITSGRVTKLKATSRRAAELFPDKSLDLVYIDAMHEYQWIAEDLRLWLPKVKPGKWIGGHDYIAPKHQEVIDAVDETFKPRGITIHTFQDWSWLAQIPHQ